MSENKNFGSAIYVKPVVKWYKKIWYAITFQWRKINHKWELLGTGKLEVGDK